MAIDVPVPPQPPETPPQPPSIPAPPFPVTLQPPAPLSSSESNPTAGVPPQPAQSSGLPPAIQVEKTDERWWIKQIQWPPFPPPGCRPRLVSIIMQNLNGPCSLLAICNILLLRGSISLPAPPDRNSVSFRTLSTILADYLVCHSSHPEHLNTALSIIPSTRTGLNLNPRFGSIDGFGPGSGEHTLFNSAGVPLVHGWVVDAQDSETWDVLVGKCGDYDKAVEKVVIGEELLEKHQSAVLADGQEPSSMEKESIQDASVIRRFLDESRTQLSYFGLFQLASSLPYDSLAALFRNSHLSVLYRRPFMAPAPPEPLPAPLPPPPDQVDPDYSHETMLEVHAIAQSLAQVDFEGLSQQQPHEDQGGVPKLFSLVTDMSFLNEPNIVWESLEDVEGGLSEFYDWDLTRSRLRDPPSRTSDRSASINPSTAPRHPIDPKQSNADMLCAQQLQEEEYGLRAAHTVNQPNSQQGLTPDQLNQPPSSQLVQSPTHERQRSQSPRPSGSLHPPYPTAPITPANLTSPGSPGMASNQRREASSASERKKKNCVIM